MVEEADESEYWLEARLPARQVIKDAMLSNEVKELERLLTEIIEIIKIMSKAKNSADSKK